jgi:hypothetical protein
MYVYIELHPVKVGPLEIGWATLPRKALEHLMKVLAFHDSSVTSSTAVSWRRKRQKPTNCCSTNWRRSHHVRKCSDLSLTRDVAWSFALTLGRSPHL